MDRCGLVEHDEGIKALLERNPMVGEPRQGPRRFWTTREIAILKATYPEGGLPACLPLLPGRSATTIYQQAANQGLKSPIWAKGGTKRQTYGQDDRIDALIRRVYQGPVTLGQVNQLARTLGRPRHWVQTRARALGVVVPRFKEPPWSEAEIEIAADNAHLCLRVIAKKLKAAGFRRTETAIHVKLKRLSACREDPNHYTARGLAELMGVDGGTVSRWIEKGWLKARRRGTGRTDAQGGDQWWIARGSVKRFIVDNVAAVDLRKVEKHWFVDLLAGPYS